MVSTKQVLCRSSFLLAAMLVFPAMISAADLEDFEDFTQGNVPGRLFVPDPASEPLEGHPLILFLHGAGERGTDNTAQVNGNIDNLLENAKQRNAYLYAPQTSTNWNNTVTHRTVMESIDLLDTVLGNVDLDRLYVTGLSMGGGGTWNMLNSYSDRFAAGVPIAGVRPASNFVPSRLTEVPIWAFHAANDTVVSFRRTEETVNRILGAAGQPPSVIPESRTFISDTLDLRYTLTPFGGHGIWGPVYDTPEVYEWMFSRSLGSITIPEPGTVGLFALSVLCISLRRAR